MEVVTGQVVRSRQGRDGHKFYLVCGHEGAPGTPAHRLLLCDGEARTLMAPKRKNPRHVNPTGTVLPQSALENDLAVKTALKAYIKQTGETEQGG